MFGAISEKFRTFDMQINFAIPPISHFRRWLGEFFSLYQSCEISIALSINLLRNYWAFPDSPDLSLILTNIVSILLFYIIIICCLIISSQQIIPLIVHV